MHLGDGLCPHWELWGRVGVGEHVGEPGCVVTQSPQCVRVPRGRAWADNQPFGSLDTQMARNSSRWMVLTGETKKEKVMGPT